MAARAKRHTLVRRNPDDVNLLTGTVAVVEGVALGIAASFAVSVVMIGVRAVAQVFIGTQPGATNA